jgi:hypothetical protein
MGGVSTLIDDEMMTVIDALDERRQELILICSQFLLEEQHEDERDQHTASLRAKPLLLGLLDGISTTRREVVKLGAVGAPSVAQLNNSGFSNSSDAPNRRAPVGQQSNATIVRSHR